MALDLIALGILGLFVALGAWRGALASGSGLISIVVSYVAAALAAGRMGPEVATRFGLPGMFGPVLAGSLAFCLTYAVCSVVALILKSWDKRRRGDDPRGGLDRMGGAFFGALRGGLIVLLLSVLATWVDAARDLGVLDGLQGAPDTEGSRVSEAAGALIESAVEAAMSDSGAEVSPAARVVARMAARPGPALASVQELLDDESIQALQEDRMFWVLVENGAGERAINQLSFYSIVHDPEIRQRLADLGFISEEQARDPEAFRMAMAIMLSRLGPRIQGLRNDPEIRRLAENPEIVALLQAGDTFALMTHPDIQRIVTRVAGDQ
jgi:membrane protein required for colicin V production